MSIHHSRPWKVVLNFLKTSIDTQPHTVDAYLDTIYFLMEVLMEPGPIVNINQEGAEVVSELKDIMEISINRFKGNPEFLFFAGYALSSVSDYLGDESDERSRLMKIKAAQIEPSNLLYKWGQASDRSAEDLRKEILDDKKIIAWLKSKGLAGNEVLKSLQVSLGSPIWDKRDRH